MRGLSAGTALAAAARGGLAGAVATLAMSAVMIAAQKVGLMGQLPPQKITSRLIHRAGAAPGASVERAAAALAHLGFGAAAGAAFAEAVELGGVRPSVPLGLVYGACVWGFSYSVPIPALGLMPPPNRDRPGRPQSMLVAHLVFGSVLALVLARLAPGRPLTGSRGQ